MSSTKEIAQHLGLSERHVRGLQAQGVITRNAALGEACVQYAGWKWQAAARRAAARSERQEELDEEIRAFLASLPPGEEVFE